MNDNFTMAVAAMLESSAYDDGDTVDEAAIEYDVFEHAAKHVGAAIPERVSDFRLADGVSFDLFIERCDDVLRKYHALQYATNAPAFMCPDTAQERYGAAMEQLKLCFPTV